MNRKVLSILVLIIIFPQMAIAATKAETIYAWGYGDLIVEALRGVVSVVGSGDFYDLFRVFMGLAIFASVFSVLFSIGKRVDYFSLLKVGIVGAIVFSLLIQVRVPVTVEDLVNGLNQPVNDVPWIIAKPLALFTQVEKVLGGVAERAFLPSSATDLSYNNVGPIAPLAVVASEVQATRPIDPYLYKSINNYVEDCVIPDILDGTKSLANLQTSTTLWTELGGTNPARFTVIYDSSDPNGTVYSCDSAYGILTGKLNTYVATDALNVLSKSIGFLSATKIASVLGVANDYFMNYSATAQDAIVQGIAINQMKDGYREWAIASGVNPDALAYSLSTATEQLKQTSLAKAITGAKFLPMAKGVATAFFVAMLPFVLLFGLFGGEKVFKAIFIVYAWFLFWHIGEIVLNAFILNSARDYLSTIANGGITLLDSASVAAAAQNKIIAFSSFYWLIPTISFGLATASAYAFTNVASGLMGMAAGAAASGAAEAAKGSANFGNLGYNNVSSNNVDWLHRENMGFENRFEAGSMSVNGMQSFTTPWLSRKSEGGGLTEKLSGHSVGEFGLGKLLSPVSRFVSGTATQNPYGGMTISGETEDGKTIKGIIDKNGAFTGTISDGRGYRVYDKGELIKSDYVDKQGYRVTKVGNTETREIGGAGVTGINGTITEAHLSSAAFKKAATEKEQLSKKAAEIEQKGKRAASDYVKTVGVNEAFNTSIKAIETVENGSQYDESYKKEARYSKESTITKTAEDLAKIGMLKREELRGLFGVEGKGGVTVKGRGNVSPYLDVGVEGNIVKIKNKDTGYEVVLTGKRAQAFKRLFAENFISSQSGSRILKAAQRGVKDKNYQKQLSEAQKWSDSVSEYMQKANEYRQEASKLSERSLSENLNVLPEAINNYLDEQGVTNPEERMKRAAGIVNKMNKLFATDPEKGLEYLNQISKGKLDALEKIEKMKVKPKPLGVNIDTSKVNKRPDVGKKIDKGKNQVDGEFNENPGRDARNGYEALYAYKNYLEQTGAWGNLTDPKKIDAVRELIIDSFNRWGFLRNDEGKAQLLGYNNNAMRIFPIRKFVPNKMLNDVLIKMQKEPDKVVDSINRRELLSMKPGEVIEAKNGEKVAKLTPGVYLAYNNSGYFAFKIDEKPINYIGPTGNQISYEKWKQQGKNLDSSLESSNPSPPDSKNVKDLF